MDLEHIVNSIESSNCNKCAELVEARKRIVVARGNYLTDLVIVGQNPGEVEDKEGIPFVGPAGKMLDAIIWSAGFHEQEDFFFTNIVLCHSFGNAAPNKDQVSNCSENLRNLIKSFDKVLVVGKSATLGLMSLIGPELYDATDNSPMRSLLTKGRPRRIGSGEDAKYVFITYHPSYLIRNGIYGGDINNPLYKLVKEEIIAAKEYITDIPDERTNIQGLW